jgi:hypothetical protein
MIHLKPYANCYTRTLHANVTKPTENFESLQMYPPCSGLMNSCHIQTLPASRNFVTIRCIVAVLDTSFSEYAVLNSLPTAEIDFDVK